MRRDPAISFRGALQILGHHDRPWLDRLNGLLGGVVLAAGGVPAIGALWGWVDQKNEAMGLLRGALDAVSDRIRPSHGLLRHELVVAAHTTIVFTAYFDTLRADLGDLYDSAAITDIEKVRLATGEWRSSAEPLIRQLYAAAVPTPSATIGFEENISGLQGWCSASNAQVRAFLRGLDLPPRTSWPLLSDAFEHHYRSNYLGLAATVPEFAVWANLGEHTATRSALSRMEDLLSVVVEAVPSRDLRAVVRDTNRLVLHQPVIDVDTDGYGTAVVFPDVEDIFVTPRYRIAHAAANQGWWDDSDVEADLDLLLARHFSTPLSTTLPLLLLGHPGAGKSLLMKVLAARLPDEGYTVVRVPLRRVDANGSITVQVQQALDLSTHGRVPWHALVDQSADVIRVVLLDGLDELLQATTNDRAGYLQEVAEFQRVEAALGRPVAAVVTSRTLVVDRVTVPSGTPVVKLEEFDETQIRRWVAVWNSHNPPMPAEFALSHSDLAGQPLLLLVLALYHADFSGPVEEHLSKADLYERLFDTYAHREVTKKAGRVLHGAELDIALEGQMRRLSTAALGMFTRGRQDITESDLGADLLSLGESATGDRLLGEFFFVHAAEARAGSVLRCYEFLHATFGEYLVAARVVEVLLDVAEGAFGRRREHEPDDDLLFALLSHQPLAIQRPVLDFIGQRLEALPSTERDWVVRVLSLLVDGYRNRKPSKSFADYRPLPPDNIRALAAYSANVVVLLLMTGATLWPGDEVERWRSTVSLWKAGLDAQGYQAMLRSVHYADGAVWDRNSFKSSSPTALGEARVRGDLHLVRVLRTGLAIHDGQLYGVGTGLAESASKEWLDQVATWFMTVYLQPFKAEFMVTLPPDDVSDDLRLEVALVGYGLLNLMRDDWRTPFIVNFAEWLVRLSPARDRSALLWVRGLFRSEVPTWITRALSGGVTVHLDAHRLALPFLAHLVESTDHWGYL